MKTSTGLNQPSGWFPFLAVVVPCLWGLSFWYWDWPLAVIAALMSVYLVLDAWNLVRKIRAARKEPKDSEEKAPRM
jgi:membrane protein implicated in regulation of membrane protease activity